MQKAISIKDMSVRLTVRDADPTEDERRYALSLEVDCLEAEGLERLLGGLRPVFPGPTDEAARAFEVDMDPSVAEIERLTREACVMARSEGVGFTRETMELVLARVWRGLEAEQKRP